MWVKRAAQTETNRVSSGEKGFVRIRGHEHLHLGRGRFDADSGNNACHMIMVGLHQLQFLCSTMPGLCCCSD